MNAQSKEARSSSDATVMGRPYHKRSLVQLVRDIIYKDDRLALRELHQGRNIFHVRSGQCVRLAEFLNELKDSDVAFQWCRCDLAVVEDAYDLTLAKFHDLPSDPDDGRSADASEGPDCRFYYGAFYGHVAKALRQRPPASLIDAEVRAAAALQRLVTRHFYLSCLECRRRAAKLVRRYAWKINGSQMVLWLPVEMNGGRCRRWLQENVPDVDPIRPGERDRVQARVDHLLARRGILSLEQVRASGIPVGVEVASEPPTWAAEVSVIGLADAVAEEKAETIDVQRPAIRSLGTSKLKELIGTVFEALAEERYHAEYIAGQFGLSKATFSRFAGCHWRRDGESTAPIPDLWKNTAHVLAGHSDFVAAAQQAGVWDRVRRVASANDRKGAPQ